MTPEDLFKQIVETPSYPQQKLLLIEHRAILNEEFAHLLRNAADEFLHSERLAFSDQLADLLLYQSELMDDRKIAALGWRVKGNAHTIGRGEFEQGIECYDRAAAIYEEIGLIDQKAASQAGKVAALASLGRYQEALDIYEWAIPILKAHGEWLRLGHLHLNIGSIIYGRQGRDVETLACFEEASECYTKVGEACIEGIAWVAMNSANIFRNQGKLEKSLIYSRRAYKMLIDCGLLTEAARSQHIIAQTYITQGRYNDALLQLQRAREIFKADKRLHDMILVDLDSANCFLQLRRFGDVLDKCRQSYAFFEKQGVHFELGQSLLYAAIAYTHLDNYDEALASLDKAHTFFVQEESPFWATLALLEQTVVLYKQQNYVGCIEVTEQCLTYLKQHKFPVQTIQAYLVGGQAAIALLDFPRTQQLLAQVQALIHQHNIPSLLYEYYYLVGKLAHAQGKCEEAFAAYEQAIEHLERQRGQLMVEFRAEFLTDKENLYQDMVGLCLATNMPERGLDYVGRSKSRALIDILTHRIDMELYSRNPADALLIQSLQQLRQKRNEVYHSWIVEQNFSDFRNIAPDTQERQTQKKLLELEKDITEIWHQLLMQNADYAGDAALWQVRVEPVQQYLDADMLLLEYFIIQDELWLFVVTAEQVVAHCLPVTVTKIQRTLKYLWKNLSKTPSQPLTRISYWTEQAQKLLQRLYDGLIAPVYEQIQGYKHLYIVPHGPLHYLPFHALYNDSHYLVERHTISYLPCASYLHYCQHTSTAENCQIFAHSSGQQLLNTIEEARIIGQLLDAQIHIEEAATIGKLQEVATNCGILHLATHGDFRADDPLFSGLVLDDGLLTTLDIFNLRLNNTALVTLSACQTGRSIVGGGNELLGLARAFLSAGANALLLTMWAVEDHSTSLLMENFYQNLSAGQSKNIALQNAQLGLMRHEEERYHHPYFWAPFILIGNIDAL